MHCYCTVVKADEVFFNLKCAMQNMNEELLKLKLDEVFLDLSTLLNSTTLLYGLIFCHVLNARNHW